MASLYIREYQQGVSGIGTTWAQMLPEPGIADQVVAIGAASVQSAAFNPKTRAVRLIADAGCSFLFGDNPIATALNARLPGDQREYFAVQPGQKIAVIANP